MFRSILKPSPFDIEVDDEGAGYATVQVAIAQDDTRIVSVVCEVANTNDICDEPCSEFSFSIDVVGLFDDSIEPFRTQDRNIAAAYIPQEIRSSVMDVVGAGLMALLEYTKPALLYWVTKDRAPPEKALPKYYLLRDLAQTLGYAVETEGTDPFGRRFWLMRRNPD